MDTQIEADKPVEDRWLVLYWSEGRWVMVEARQFITEDLARSVLAEYRKVLGPKRARMLYTGSSVPAEEIGRPRSSGPPYNSQGIPM
jgi:hypothetical protein